MAPSFPVFAVEGLAAHRKAEQGTKNVFRLKKEQMKPRVSKRLRATGGDDPHQERRNTQADE
ncbi:hypothetical protein DESC_870038 [Desulfosarcina cetonica]|nr:hypothetical protein DESC_870038 [Desulfosarcina cetonica]